MNKVFSGTCDGYDDMEIFNTNFVIQEFNRQTTAPSDNWQNSLFPFY